MSSQPSSKSSRPTGQASYHQLHPEESREPDPDISDNTHTAMPPRPPPAPTRTTRPRPNIFKSKPFSQMEIQGGKRPTRPPGPKPKPLHALEITDLYPDDDDDDDDDPNISPAPPLDRNAAQDAATQTRSPLNPDALSGEGPTISAAPSRSLPLPAPSKQAPPLLPLHAHPNPSGQHLLRLQGFLSFLMEYTTSFANHVFDLNASHHGCCGSGRSRARRDARYYGEREGGPDGHGNQVREGRRGSRP